MFSRAIQTLLLLITAACSSEVSTYAQTTDLPLNHYQFIGTHNSYHIAPSAQFRNLINTFSPGQGEALNYTHKPLREQLEKLGIRQIELDIYGDPQGGAYNAEVIKRFPNYPPILDDPLWKKPGFKIFHSPDFDQNSTAPTLRLALQELLGWSKDHPDHEPVLVLLELETESFTAAGPPVFDAKALQALEAEIREEMPDDKILTPDEVRGESPTLREAVTARGWPALEKLKGQFIFALDNEDASRDTYLSLSPNRDLKERICFVSVPPTHAAAAWMKRNDAIASHDEIQNLVKAGFVVRTRADADMKEVLANDRTRLNAALSSGAQWISSDAPEPVAAQPLYFVAFPDRTPYRRNPLFP